jgi:nitroreductase
MAANDWTQADVTQCVDQVLQSRRSVRAYRPDPLAGDRVLEVLQAASCAPSNSNTQPWRVHVVTGAALRQLGDALVAAFRHGDFPPPAHFPDPLPGEFQERQAEFAARYYGALGIPRDDMPARLAQTERNFHFFGAPVGLLFTIDARLTRHSWLDLGLFVQNVMLAARSRGLDTCPQVSFARYHAVIASHLDLPPEEVTACGMSMGIRDGAAGVNRMDALPRRSVADFARLVGFDTHHAR